MLVEGAFKSSTRHTFESEDEVVQSVGVEFVRLLIVLLLVLFNGALNDLDCPLQRQALVQEFRVNYESRTQQQNIEVIILRNELKTILNQSFERLTILERTIMTDMVNGYKPHSIAQRFNIEHKVVYNGIQRAKRKIKRYLLLWWQ